MKIKKNLVFIGEFANLFNAKCLIYFYFSL